MGWNSYWWRYHPHWQHHCGGVPPAPAIAPELPLDLTPAVPTAEPISAPTPLEEVKELKEAAPPASTQRPSSLLESNLFSPGEQPTPKPSPVQVFADDDDEDVF